MKRLGLGLLLLLSTQILVAKESVSTLSHDSGAKEVVQDERLLKSLAAALQSLGIDAEVKEIKELIDKNSEIGKLELLALIIKSPKGLEQFRAKYGRDPQDSDIETAYRLLEVTYASLGDKKTKDGSGHSSKDIATPTTQAKQKTVSNVLVGKLSSLVMDSTHSHRKNDKEHQHHERPKATVSSAESAAVELCSACGHRHAGGHHHHHDHNDSHGHHGHRHSHDTLAHACGSGCSH